MDIEVDPQAGSGPPEPPSVTTEPIGAATVAPGSDGSRRRRTALAVVGVAVVAGLVGGVIGYRIQSPADRAAAQAAPVPSLITVPVERRELTSELVLAGSVEFNEPTTVQLAGGVGIGADEAAVVTDMRQTGDEIQEGDMLLEVTGRPVLVLQGDLPMYRRMVIGTEGPDVAQLEQALVRLGYDVGTVDTVFDVSTAAAVDTLYSDAGYAAEGPSVDERDALTAAQDGVRDAEEGLRAAQDALDRANEPMLPSERLQLDRSLQEARDAVPAAEQAKSDAISAADQQVDTAIAARDSAQVASDAATARRDQAIAGAIDPDTGAPYTPDRTSQLTVEAAQAQEQLAAAVAAAAQAEIERTRATEAADDAIADARFQLTLTEAQYAEATASGGDESLTTAVDEARSAVASAQANLQALQLVTGPRISPGEIVFVPVLPSTLTEVYVGLGAAVQGPIGTLATSSTLITGRVSRVDASLVAVGAAVSIDIRGSGVTTTGSVVSVGAPPAQPSGDTNEGGFSPSSPGPDQSGRLVVTITPDDPDTVSQYVFWDARIVVSIASTDGEVLVVPVAALTVGPDQTSQVEVERTPATDDEPAITEVVTVEVGLTANGLAEVRPAAGSDLAEGDRVVVGVETNERLNEDDSDGPDVPNDDGPDVPNDDGSVDDDDGSDGDDGSDDDDGDGSDDDDDGDDDVSSPLAELLGFDFDPVESRRQQLEVEEKTAECMRDLGFEYEPVDYAAQFGTGGDLQFEDPEAFGEQYGYGVMYNYELYEVGGGMGGPEFVDPNQDYVSSLSPDEQNAYYAALYGEPTEEPIDEPSSSAGTVVAAPAPEQQGCSGIANAEVYGQNPADDPEIQQALGDIFTSIQDEPRLAEAIDQWTECMEPAFDEHDIADPPASLEEMYAVIERLKSEAQGLEAFPFESEAEMNDLFESEQVVITSTMNEDGSGIAYIGEPQELSGDEIDRLTAIEVELWTADQACQDDLGIARLRIEIEQEAVEQLLQQFPELDD